jgi:hypothetical protein
MFKLIKFSTIFCATGILLSSCWTYKPLDVNDSKELKKVVISRYEITDDNRLYQSNGISFRDNSNSKIGRENTLPKKVVRAIYDTTDARIGGFTSATVSPKLDKLNKKYFEEYDLPDYSRSNALKKHSMDAAVEVFAKLSGGNTFSGSGFRKRTPVIRVKARMYDRNNQLIWRNKVKLKGRKIDSGQLQFGGFTFSVSEGLTMDDVQQLFDAALQQLFNSKNNTTN